MKPSAWLMHQAGLTLVKTAEPKVYKRDQWTVTPLYGLRADERILLEILAALREAGLRPLKAMQWAARAADVTLTAQEVAKVLEIGRERVVAAYRYL